MSKTLIRRNNFNEDRFFRLYNDVYFYIEDKDKQDIYKRILKKILNEDIKFENIFSPGGKEKVIEKIETSQNNAEIRVYILDKDFDDKFPDHPLKRLKDKTYNQVKEIDGVFYLAKYSIENFFCDDGEGIFEYIIDKLALSSEILKEHFRYDQNISEIKEALLQMLPYYIFSFHFDLNLSYSDNHRYNKGLQTYEFEKLQVDFESQRARFNEKHSNKNFDEEFKKIKDMVIDESDLLGKHLLTILFWYFEEDYSKENLNKGSKHLSCGKQGNYIYQLSSCCTFDSLKEFGQKIEEYVRGKQQNN